MAEHYRADGGEGIAPWTPGIFMPRRIARIILEVMDLRAERLQDIAEEDARAEGMLYHDGRGVGHSGFRHSAEYGVVCGTAREAFEVGWDTINGKRASWSSNPYVWVVSFRRVQI